MLKKIAPLFLLVLSLQIFAQSPRTVLIEHFTNTKCSICASRNPGFYNTLSGYPQVIHIAFHPSAPYNSCYFNLQNVAENDSRTNYYGIYGSTPQFVLNGKHLPSANPAITNTTIDTALNQTAPIEVAATEELFNGDSVKVRVVVSTTGNISAQQLLLFAGVTQDTIQYSAGNGEQLHRDVFRKALTNVAGNAITVPALNDSAVFFFTYKIQSGWRETNLNTITWLQTTDTKQVLNAGKSHRVVNLPSAINDIKEKGFSVYPNPVKNELHITVPKVKDDMEVEVFNMLGSKIFSEHLPATNYTINAINWNSGFYFVRIGNTTKRIVKE